MHEFARQSADFGTSTIQARSDLAWMALACLHNVGARFFLYVTLLFLSLTTYVIFGLFLKCLHGAECGQNRHADLAEEQILSVVPSPPRS